VGLYDDLSFYYLSKLFIPKEWLEDMSERVFSELEWTILIIKF